MLLFRFHCTAWIMRVSFSWSHEFTDQTKSGLKYVILINVTSTFVSVTALIELIWLSSYNLKSLMMTLH